MDQWNRNWFVTLLCIGLMSFVMFNLFIKHFTVTCRWILWIVPRYNKLINLKKIKYHEDVESSIIRKGDAVWNFGRKQLKLYSGIIACLVSSCLYIFIPHPLSESWKIPSKALYSYLFSLAPYCYCAGESYSGPGRAPEECVPWLPFIEEGAEVATLLPPAARPRFCQNLLFISHPTHPEFFAQSRSEDKQIILEMWLPGVKQHLNSGWGEEL